MTITSPQPLQPLPIDTPLVAKPGLLDHAVANLMHYLPDCVLVSIPSGMNPDHVSVSLIDEAGTPAFQSRLAINNVAVALGPRSEGLLAITFADRVALTDFLERNPSSRETLVTEHAGGTIVWHKANTPYRVPLQLPDCTIHMNGNVLVFNRADVRRADVFLHPAPPTRVSLPEVNWGTDPRGQLAVWLARLRHGEFCRRTGRGQLIPLTQTWRAYLTAKLKPTTLFDTREQQFYSKVNVGDWQPVADERMCDELRRLVQAAPIGTTEFRSRVTDEWLVRLCSRLKSSLATHLPLAEAALRVFLEQHLIKEPGANVTSTELVLAFEAYCCQTEQPALSPKQFRVLVGRILRGEPWLVCRSKSILRPRGEQNGWRGVRLKHASMTHTALGGADGVRI